MAKAKSNSKETENKSPEQSTKGILLSKDNESLKTLESVLKMIKDKVVS